MEELAMIAQLRTALSELNVQTSWSAVLSLESALESDPRHSDYERQLIRQLRSQVTDLIAAKRDGHNPHPGSARATATALESSIKKRTTGPDGWKLA